MDIWWSLDDLPQDIRIFAPHSFRRQPQDLKVFTDHFLAHRFSGFVALQLPQRDCVVVIEYSAVVGVRNFRGGVRYCLLNLVRTALVGRQQHFSHRPCDLLAGLESVSIKKLLHHRERFCRLVKAPFSHVGKH
ncbi:hypothetical protein D3C76_1163520 [compost metagenome]